MAKIEVRGVTKRYGTKTAVDDVSLSVEEGEFVVLLGPSGSGKTSLLRCVAGLEKQDHGEVLIGGKDVSLLTPAQRDVSMVFQSYALFPLMSVAGNISFPLDVRGVAEPEKSERVREVSRRLGIEGLLAKSPRQLSGGEQQRVSIARAMVRKTNCFLMDEPLSNLDAPLRAELRVELRRLQRELGITVLYVTHDQVEAMTLADKMGVLWEGKLLQFGRPLDLYEEPTDVRVARFVGSQQTNLIEFEVASADDILHLRSGPVKLEVPRALLRGPKQGDKILVSVRPEHIGLSLSPLPSSFEAAVGLTEHLGSSTVVHLSAGGVAFRASAPADFTAEEDTRIQVLIDGTRVRAFDPLTGKSLK